MSTKEELMDYILETPNNTNPAILSQKIDEIINSSGTTVIANPEGEATDDLDKIQIGDEIYGISGGGGGILVATAYLDEDLESLVLDKTYNEITASLANKIPVYIFLSNSWEEEGVMYDAHQLYPVHYCYGDSGTGYKVYIIGFRGGTVETYFYSGTRDGVLIIEP